METKMSASYPVSPAIGGTMLRGFASLLAQVTHWLKELIRARQHRRQAGGRDLNAQLSESRWQEGAEIAQTEA